MSTPTPDELHHVCVAINAPNLAMTAHYDLYAPNANVAETRSLGAAVAEFGGDPADWHIEYSEVR